MWWLKIGGSWLLAGLSERDISEREMPLEEKRLRSLNDRSTRVWVKPQNPQMKDLLVIYWEQRTMAAGVRRRLLGWLEVD